MEKREQTDTVGMATYMKQRLYPGKYQLWLHMGEWQEEYVRIQEYKTLSVAFFLLPFVVFVAYVVMAYYYVY